jgi:hypothetical protein
VGIEGLRFHDFPVYIRGVILARVEWHWEPRSCGGREGLGIAARSQSAGPQDNSCGRRHGVQREYDDGT